MFDLAGVEIPAEDAVRVVIGGDAAIDTDEVVHMEHTTPVLAADATAHVEKPTPAGTEIVAVAPVERDMLVGSTSTASRPRSRTTGSHTSRQRP